MDSSSLVPVVMVGAGAGSGSVGGAGWPCVKVNVKGLFVSARQPSMRVGDGPEYSPWARTAAPPLQTAHHPDTTTPLKKKRSSNFVGAGCFAV